MKSTIKRLGIVGIGFGLVVCALYTGLFSSFSGFYTHFEEELGNQYVLWHIDVNNTYRSYTDLPRYYQGKVFIATEQGLLWVDSQTGKRLQKINFKDSIECIYSNKHIFVFFENKLLCFDLQKQEKIWEFQFEPEEHGCRCGTFTVGEGKIYVSYEPAHVYCIDEVSGDVCWQYKGEGTYPEIDFSHHYLIVRTRLAMGKRLDMKIVCLNGETGEPLWEMGGAESRVYVYGLQDDVIIVEDIKDQHTMVVDIYSGALLWYTLLQMTVDCTVWRLQQVKLYGGFK